MVPRVLSLTPVRYVGRISYGIYIWHWPLFLWINHERTGLDGYPLFFVRVLVTLVVSALSFHLVERPIRMGTFLHQWRAWVAVPVAVVVVVAALIAATVDTSALASTTYPGSIGTSASAATGHGSTSTKVAGATSAGPPVRVLLFGDSVALTLGCGPRGGADPAQVRLHALRQGDPRLRRGRRARGRAARCGRRDAAGLQRLAAHPGRAGHVPALAGPVAAAMAAVKPNVVVVLAGRWEVVDREYKGTWTNILHPAYAAYVKSQLEMASRLVTTTGANLVFLTAPCTDEGEQPDGQPWPEDDPARLAEYNKLVRQVAALHPKTDSVVDLDAAACPGGKFTDHHRRGRGPAQRRHALHRPRAVRSWPRTSCRRSWRPAGPRWRRAPRTTTTTAAAAASGSAGG